MNELKSIDEIKNLKGKKVLLRVDFNVPVEEGKVINDFRVKKTLPTIDYLLEMGAKVLIISHMSGNEVNSLRPVFESKLLSKYDIKFVEDCLSKEARSTVDNLSSGQVVMFENLRNNPGEKENDTDFAKKLASLADVYVNEAFAVSHREHASIVGLPKLLPSYAGNLFLSEVENLSIALEPPHPFLFILGGAKFKTKLPLAEKFSNIADHLVLGGALSNEIFQNMGIGVGKSLVSDSDFSIEDFNKDVLILPLDLKVTDEASMRVTDPRNIEPNERVVDIGPKTIEKIKDLSEGAKLIVWNGPVGEYKEGYKETSLAIARILAESGSKTITGGGDTLSAIAEIKVENKFTFVSTAGGAMLDFLADGTLPGIEALKESQKSDRV